MRHAAFSCIAFAALLAAQEPRTAAAVTEPGRSLQRALDMVLGGPSNDAIERTLVVVVDPTKDLLDCNFADAFAAAVERNRKTMTRTRLGLGIVGTRGCIVEPPTLAHGKITTALRRHVKSPDDGFHNVYVSLRAAASALYRSSGERSLLLVTLENGDLEDDVEKTVEMLKRAKIRVEILTSETTLSDNYWAARPNQQKPSGTQLTGGDGAVTDVPWGFLFQRFSANEMTPAGYAMWGLTRLAAGTGGRVFLHATAVQQRHQCAFFGTCLFCSNDHQPADRSWNTALVEQLAPLAVSRKATLKSLGSDAGFRALIKTWLAAAKEGLLQSEPGVRVRTTSASPDRLRAGRRLRLLDTANFARNARRAEQAARKAAQLRDQLTEMIAALPADGVAPRALASAKYTVVLLQLTRVNLLTFAGFCREIAPEWFDPRTGEPLPPEVVPIERDRRPHGIFFYNLSLCHGVRPFYDVELPGGEALRQELIKLEALFNGFQHRYGKSPFGYALRRNGIARFYPTFPGRTGPAPRRRPKSGPQPPGPKTPRRPSRKGGSSGSGSGPTTGGGG